MISQSKNSYSFNTSTNLCVQNVAGYCLTTDGSKCLTCYSGFILTSPTATMACIPAVIPNCMTLTTLPISLIACTACAPGYQTMTNPSPQCIPINSVCSIPNCTTYTDDSHMDYYYCSACATVSTTVYEVDEGYTCSYDAPVTGGKSDSLADPVITTSYGGVLLALWQLIIAAIVILIA